MEEQTFGRRFFPLEKAFRYEFRNSERKFSEYYWRSEDEEPIALGGIIPDRKIDPIENFGEYVSRIFCCSGRANMKMFGKETFHLRENICRLLSNQNIYVTPKNLQLVAETSQAIVYIITLYLREGDTIIAEGPDGTGYLQYLLQSGNQCHYDPDGRGRNGLKSVGIRA